MQMNPSLWSQLSSALNNQRNPRVQVQVQEFVLKAHKDKAGSWLVGSAAHSSSC